MQIIMVLSDNIVESATIVNDDEAQRAERDLNAADRHDIHSIQVIEANSLDEALDLVRATNDF